MFQENPLRTQHAVKIQARSVKAFTKSRCLLRYLVPCSDDKHSPQDEALAVHVALVAGPPGPHEVLPHSEADEPQAPHLPLQRAIEVLLQSHSFKDRMNLLFQVTVWLFLRQWIYFTNSNSQTDFIN